MNHDEHETDQQDRDLEAAKQGDHEAEEQGQVQTTKLVVTGMTCGHCVSAVTDELTEVHGVLEVRVGDIVKDGDTDVFVDSDGPLDLTAARGAVEEAGYTARV